jgi:hypothetical protein
MDMGRAGPGRVVLHFIPNIRIDVTAFINVESFYWQSITTCNSHCKYRQWPVHVSQLLRLTSETVPCKSSNPEKSRTKSLQHFTSLRCSALAQTAALCDRSAILHTLPYVAGQRHLQRERSGSLTVNGTGPFPPTTLTRTGPNLGPALAHTSLSAMPHLTKRSNLTR